MVISRSYAKQAALLAVVALSACTPQSAALSRSPSPAAILPVNPIYAGRAMAFDVNATFSESMNESFTVQDRFRGRRSFARDAAAPDRGQGRVGHRLNCGSHGHGLVEPVRGLHFQPARGQLAVCPRASGSQQRHPG